MTNTALTLNAAALPRAFQGVHPENDALRGGMPESFATLSIKSSRFTLRYRGVDHVLKDGNNFVSTLDVVMLRCAPYLSKIYYPTTYQEGDDAQPTCFSIDSTVPDPAAAVKQSPTCAACQHNQWGSKITPQGNATKACADSRRIAIVPVTDIDNPQYGGPVLLRVPPASLKNLAQYGSDLDRHQIPYFAVATRLSFLPTAAYPQLTFTATRTLTDIEADQVVRAQQNPLIERMLTAAQQPVAPASPQAQPHAPVTPVAPTSPAPPRAPPPNFQVQPPPPLAPMPPTAPVSGWGTPTPQPQPEPQPVLHTTAQPSLTPPPPPPVPVYNQATGQWELPTQAPPPPAPVIPPQPQLTFNAATGQWEMVGQGVTPPATQPASEPTQRRRRGRPTQATQAVTDAVPVTEPAQPTAPPPVPPVANGGAPVAVEQQNGAAPLGNVQDFIQPASAGLAAKVTAIIGS